MIKLHQLLLENKDSIAVLIGNGINHHYKDKTAISWDNLVINIWNKKHPQKTIKVLPSGISLLEVAESCSGGILDIAKLVANEIGKMEISYSSKLIDKLLEYNIPVLTTNYDLNIEKSVGAKQNTNLSPITDKSGLPVLKEESYFRWYDYYSPQKNKDTLNSFGIWHIHGVMTYPETIKITSSDYFDAINYKKRFIDGLTNIFNFKKPNFKSVKNSWLKIVFNKSICIIGLGLDREELFLRWLLNMRYKYYKYRLHKEPIGWYVFCTDHGKIHLSKPLQFYLKSVGFGIIRVEDYKEIYDLQ